MEQTQQKLLGRSKGNALPVCTAYTSSYVYGVRFCCLDNMDMSTYVKLTEFSAVYFSISLSTSLNKL